jgi:hypothetical protein
VVQARSGRGHDQPLPATSVAFPGAWERYLDHTGKPLSQAHLEKNRSYLKCLVALKGNAAGVRPQVAGAMENDNATRDRTLYAPEVQAGFTFGLRTHPCIGGPIVFVAATAGLVHSSPTTARPSQAHINRIWRINRSSLKVSVRRIVQGDDMEKGLSARRVSPFRKEKP